MTIVKSEYYFDPDTGQRYVLSKPGGATTEAGEEAGLIVIADGAILAAIWTNAGNEPDPELYAERQIGADSDGVAAGATYHVVGAIGSKAWVLTGATVKNLYGGA